MNPKRKASSLATLLFGLLVVSNLSGCRAQQSQPTSVTVTESNESTLQNWEKFLSPDGAFAIMFPQKPVESQYSMDSPAGKLVIHSYQYNLTINAAVEYGDIAAAEKGKPFEIGKASSCTEGNAELVGFAKGTPHDDGGFAGELNKIYLLHSFHRQGLGRLLLCNVAHL